MRVLQSRFDSLGLLHVFSRRRIPETAHIAQETIFFLSWPSNPTRESLPQNRPTIPTYAGGALRKSRERREEKPQEEGQETHTHKGTPTYKSPRFGPSI